MVFKLALDKCKKFSIDTLNTNEYLLDVWVLNAVKVGK